ncbi:MAG: hypothetical protein LBI02_08120 [Opitutaceae bacterium]|jgi:hypothetical protein|nr:hypothetical protein [Opitutaceae bacterium]
MTALSAAQFNSVIKSFYQCLCSSGQLPNVALTAVMRKLAGLLNLIFMFPNFPLAR